MVKSAMSLEPLAIDLNCDMGESFGAYTIGNDKEAVCYISSANIACGLHASDPGVMKNTVRLCKEHGVMAGAHPGYPDLAGFGRRQIDMSDEEIIDSTLYQAGALKAFTDFFAVPLQHVKLHGALYHYAVKNEKLFLDIVQTLKKTFGVRTFFTLGIPEARALKDRLASEDIFLALEAFPDRNYADDGSLMPRQDPRGVIKDAHSIAQRALAMIRERSIRSANGHRIDLEIDTICIHGDNPESVKAASIIREYAQREGITIRAPGM
ncbi:MAG: 5-oxoprolinase subunit PxpA [Syntrophorhabdaceae bacterium]